MAASGRNAPFSGDIVGFKDIHPAQKFLNCLSIHLQKFKGTSPGKESHLVPVRAYIVDESAYLTSECASSSKKESGCVYVYLDRGAVHACSEFDMKYFKADNRPLPECALPVIDDIYYSVHPLRQPEQAWTA